MNLDDHEASHRQLFILAMVALALQVLIIILITFSLVVR